MNSDWIEHFPELLSRRERQEPPPSRLQTLCEMIRKVQALKHHQQIVVVIDALDECVEDRLEFLTLLPSLIESVSVFVTS